MHVVIAYIVLVALLLGTYVMWRASQRRAAAARIEPMHPTMIEPHRAGPDQIRAAILGFCAAHPGLKVEDSHGNILVTWKLPPAKGSIPSSKPVDHTWSVELKLSEPGTVLARYGDAAVHWTHVESTKLDEPSLHRIYDWRWDMNAKFETPEALGEETVLVPEDKPYTSQGLVVPLQRVVLSNGWAWQPTLDFPEGAESETITDHSASQQTA